MQVSVTTPGKVIVSRSQLSDFMRCRKKFELAHIEGIEDTSPGSVPMRFGTFGHWGLAHGYKAMRQAQQASQNGFLLGREAMTELFVNSAHEAMRAMLRDDTYEYRGETKPLRLAADEYRETVATALDVVRLYAETYAYEDYMRYKIVSVEDDYRWEFAITLPNGEAIVVEMSGVMDLCAEDTSHTKKILTVFDHKFVGNVNLALEFLPLDTQMLVYELIVWYVGTQVLGYDDVEVVYDMVRREVPPGYGSRSEKTASGVKSKASKEITDYVRRTVLFHSTAERGSIESNFLRPVLGEMLWAKTNGGVYYINPIKTGGEACKTGCAYFERCKAQLVGRGQPRFVSKA